MTRNDKDISLNQPVIIPNLFFVTNLAFIMVCASPDCNFYVPVLSRFYSEHRLSNNALNKFSKKPPKQEEKNVGLTLAKQQQEGLGLDGSTFRTVKPVDGLMM